MTGCFRACGNDTRARPPAAAGALFPSSRWAVLLSVVPVSVVLADGDGWRVVAAGAQGLVLRVVGQDDAFGAELVDQGCRTVRASHLSQAAVPVTGCPGRLASRMAIAARCGRIWSSRM